MGYRIYMNFIFSSPWSQGKSQASAHAVRINCNRRTGTGVGIPQPVHGKYPARKSKSCSVTLKEIFSGEIQNIKTALEYLKV